MSECFEYILSEAFIGLVLKLISRLWLFRFTLLIRLLFRFTLIVAKLFFIDRILIITIRILVDLYFYFHLWDVRLLSLKFLLMSLTQLFLICILRYFLATLVYSLHTVTLISCQYPQYIIITIWSYSIDTITIRNYLITIFSSFQSIYLASKHYIPSLNFSSYYFIFDFKLLINALFILLLIIL